MKSMRLISKTWDSVDVNSLPPILVIGIFQIHSVFTDDGEFTSTKLSDRFDFPVVRYKPACLLLLRFLTICNLTSNELFLLK